MAVSTTIQIVTARVSNSTGLDSHSEIEEEQDLGLVEKNGQWYSCYYMYNVC